MGRRVFEVYKEMESKVSISAEKTIQFLLEKQDFAHALYSYGKSGHEDQSEVHIKDPNMPSKAGKTF